MMAPDVSPGERLYSFLLRAYPPHVRERFAMGMTYAFCRDRDRARARGVPAQLVFWVATIATTLWFGFLARTSSVPQRATLHPSGDFKMRHLFTIDWRDAWRSLRATPLVTSIAVLSLALGIGANTALFSILNSLILKSLPVRDPQQLALSIEREWTNPIWEAYPRPRARARRRRLRLVDRRIRLVAGRTDDASRESGRAGGCSKSSGCQRCLAGRLTRPTMRAVAAPDGAVAVISYGFWQRRYGGAADVIGRRLTIQRVPFTIVGITPQGFFGPDVGRAYDVAIPIGAEPLLHGAESMLDGRSTWWLNIMVRLKPGQSVEQATALLRGLQPQIRLATIPPDGTASLQRIPRRTVHVRARRHGSSSLRRRYEQPLTAILVVVGLVLLIACANIANLLLARAVARRHELSVRLALGASRLRLARQLLAESVLLSAAGAALGLAFADWGSRMLVSQLATSSNSVYLDLSFDWRVLGFTMLVAVATSIVFGLAPAVGISGVAPNEAIKEQSRGIVVDSRFSVRNALVVTAGGVVPHARRRRRPLRPNLLFADDARCRIRSRSDSPRQRRRAAERRCPRAAKRVVRAAAAVGRGGAGRGAGSCVVHEPARQRRLEYGRSGAPRLDVDAAPADVLGQRSQRRLVRHLWRATRGGT